MTVTNPAKFWLLLVTLVGLLTLVGVGRITFGEASPFLTFIVGYGVGNGVRAVRGQPDSPLFGTRLRNE